MLQLSFVILLVCFARSDAGIFSLSPGDLQENGDFNIATIVHNTPSAVTHTSFIRLHNHPNNGNQNLEIAQSHLDSVTDEEVTTVNKIPSTAVQQLNAIPSARVVNHATPTVQLTHSNGSSANVVTANTSKVQTLRHTPAHLTYSARPVVYQTLPDIKPVRKISFDESVPSPRNTQYTNTP